MNNGRKAKRVIDVDKKVDDGVYDGRWKDDRANDQDERADSDVTVQDGI